MSLTMLIVWGFTGFVIALVIWFLLKPTKCRDCYTEIEEDLIDDSHIGDYSSVDLDLTVTDLGPSEDKK